MVLNLKKLKKLKMTKKLIKKETAFKKNADEIKWNLINSLLSGLLVLTGSLAGNNFQLNFSGVCASILTSLVVALTKFQNYWTTQESEYKRSSVKNLFCFVGAC